MARAMIEIAPEIVGYGLLVDGERFAATKY
jgi:hypothetical protein